MRWTTFVMYLHTGQAVVLPNMRTLRLLTLKNVGTLSRYLGKLISQP